MEFRHLRYFVAVAEEKHFGRAAERLHMAQPPLSAQIKQLENELGTLLFERTTRKVDLTPAGKLLLARAYEIQAAVEAAVHDVAEVGRGSSGVLRVGFAGTATYNLMPEIIRSMAKSYPSVVLKVHGEMLTPSMEDQLLEGKLDLAVLRPPIASEKLAFHEIQHTSLALAMSKNHPLAEDSGPVSPEDVMGVDVVSYPRGSSIATIAIEACRRRGFRPKIVQTATETSTLIALVAANIGVAFVPDSQGFPLHDSIVLRPLADEINVGLAVAWKKDALSPLGENFVQVAAEVAQTLPTLNTAHHP